MGLALKGRKSSSTTSRKATRHDDTLFGQDTVEVLLGVSEGPIYGLKEGATSFYVGDVPLLDRASQTPNISNFELRVYKGTNPADSIRLNLGGISSTKNVGLELRVANQSVVVQLDKTQIDYLDLRMIVQQLFAVSPEGGEFPIDVQFKVEVKPRSSATWQIPFNNEPPPTSENGSGASAFRPASSTAGMVVNDAYRETYTQDAPPTGAKARGAMWFNTGTAEWTPRIWDGAAWAVPTNLARRTVGAYPVWSWLDFDGAIRQAWFSPAGTAPPPDTLARGDFLLTPQSGGQIYSYNDTAWVGFQDWAEPAPAAPGVLTINGLTRSTYPKEFRIPVARINEPYDVRVTRLSPVTTKEIFRNITFESVQEVNRDAVSFPDLAVAWLTIKATDTFTSIPEFTGIYRGLVIPVPSNYTFDETTQSGTYTGLWDGSFKMAYTNNPAWHAYNFIMNSRYGKNSYFPEVADKWDYYAFGRHCDAHQFRFNEYITEPRSLNELINYVVGIAGGRYVDRGDGYSTVIWDADDQPAVAIFAPENTAEGAFTYSFTDVTERKNDYRVSFKNPELNYREDRLRVFDQNSIDVHGRNAEEFVAVGCRDAAEAVKRGRLRLATALTEKIIVSFKTNRLGRYLLPFQVILVADDQSTNVMTGRVKNPDPLPVGTTRLPLRDQIYLEAGISYSAQFTVADDNGGLKVVSYPLTVTTPGQQTQLVLSQALAQELPEYAVFSIGAPKAFRITGIEPDDEDPDFIDIVAIEVNRQKWAFVDGLVELRDILGVQTGPLSKFVYAPTNARITPEISTAGELSLVTTWNPTETKLNRGYRVYQSINGQPMQQVYEGDQLLHRQQSPVAGTYVHSIVAVGLDGTTESAPVTVSYIVANAGSLRSVAAPTNLRLVDEPEAPIFRAVDPRFTWDAAADPMVTKYLVEVVNGSNRVVHSETVSGFLQFTYSLAANRADNGGVPLRQFTVRVRSIDMAGNLSEPAALVVSHPAPIAPSFELSAVSEVVFVNTSEPTGDWAGTLVFMEKVSGFNPVTTAPKADNRSTFFPMPAEAEQTYYVRVAAYDSYGKTGLNYSPEKVIKATIKLFDPLAPPIPGTPTLVSNVAEVAPDGTVTSKITITWPGVTSTNLATYEVAIAEGNNPAEAAYVGGRFASAGPMALAGLMPGRVYSLKVRSNPKNGFADSGWSPILVVTAALNTTPPNAPTAFTVNASFEAANLSWTNPTNKDLLGVEVWAGTTNVLANATLLKTVPAPASFYRDVLGTTATKFYWIRAVNTSDFKSGYVGPFSATSAALAGAQLAAGIVDETKIASSIALNKTVAALPAAKGTDYVTFNGEQYRWDAATAKYTKAVSAADIAGKILAAQIDTINSAQIAGQVQAAQIAAVEASKISGQLTSAQITSLDATKLAGQITNAQIASGLDASKVSGALANATLATSALSGTIVDSQIAAGVSAAKVSGDLTNATLATARLSGTISNDQIANGIAAAKIAGQLTTTQIGDSAITTGKLAAAAVEAGNIAAGAIVASKLAVASINFVPNGDIAQGTLGHAVNADSGHGLTTTAIAVEPLSGPDSLPNLVLSGTGSLVAGKRLFSTSRVQRTGGNYDLLPVTPGQWYEVSAYLSGSPGARGFVAAVWYTSAAGYITEHPGNILTLQDAPAGGLTTRPRSFRVVQAPANAAYLVVRCNLDSPSAAVTDPVLRIAGIMAAPAVAGQTEPSPFISPGQTIVSGSNILTRTITASAIAVGGIIAENIAAKAITASKMVLVDSQNLNLNPSFQQGWEDWLRAPSAQVTLSNAASGDLPAGCPALNAARLSRTTANTYVQSLTDPGDGSPRGTPCSAGDLFYLEAWVIMDVAGSVGLQAVGYTAANVLSGGAVVSINVPAGVWTKVSATVNVGATMIGANCRVQNNTNTSNLWVTNVRFQRKNGAELVVDGSISARKLMIGATAPNLAPLGEFLDGLVGWDKPENVNFIIGRTGGPTGGNYLRLSRNGAAPTSLNAGTLDYIPCEGGSVYEASCFIRADAAWAVTGFRYRLMWFDENKVATTVGGPGGSASYTDVFNINQPFTAAWAQISKQVTSPVSARYVRFQVYHHIEGTAAYLDIANIMVRRVLSATVIENGAITTDKIQANAITGQKLAIASANMAFNPDGSQGTLGYYISSNNTGAAFVSGGVQKWTNSGVPYAPSGFLPVYIQLNNTAAVADVAQFISNRVNPDGSRGNYPVLANNTYEISACVSAHRCTGTVAIAWYDVSGAYLSETAAGPISSSTAASGGTYAEFPKASLIARAPANAVGAAPIFRMQNIVGANAYLFVSAVMFAVTRAGATEASPYVAPGITTIDGSGILTNSITTRVIAAGAVTANEIAANAVTATKILAGSVQTAHMTAGSINADRLIAQSITAGLIAASTITGDKIAGRTVSAGNIVTGTLTGNEIQANSVNADRLVANSITTAQIAAGAIKAGQIDAAAITADKLGVGLNTGNLIWNSDREVPGFVVFNTPATGYGTSDGNTDWTVSGQKGIAILAAGAGAANRVAYFDLQYPAADGTKTSYLPVQAGQTYEWTCYLSAHRCRAYIEAYWYNGSALTVAGYGSDVLNVAGVGAPADSWRSRLKVTAPADAVSIFLRVVQVTTGANDGYLVASAPYFGLVPPGTPANVYSAYSPQSRTVISGGQVATNSLNANRIVAGSITTDRVATGGLHADRIQSGTITTTQVQAGGIHADRIQAGTITATQIAANSITAGRLNIEVRGIMPVNVYFEMERDGNGNATGWLKWTAGQVEWIDDNGNRAFSGIPAGRMQRGSDGWVTVWFDKTAPGQLWANPGNNIPAIRANPNCVLVATSADLTGVIVNWGGTVIDGDKIVANSIQARNIAANQIQTGHMAANSISGDRIQAGTLSADRITTGTLTTSSTISLGSNGQTDIVAYPEGGTMRVRNRALNQWRAAFGYLGPWTGDGDDFGLLLWGADGVNRVRFSNTINFIDGAVILDATITSAKIGSLQVKSANIENLTVSNAKIADFAVSTVTAASGGGMSIVTNTVSRSNNSKFLILAFFNGNSSLGSNLGPGSFYIYRNGAQLSEVKASYAIFKPDSGPNQYYLTSMCIGVIDQPGTGSVSYSCQHTNGQQVGGVTIVSMELAK